MVALVAVASTIMLGVSLRAQQHDTDNFEYRQAHVLSRLDDYNFVIDVPLDQALPDGERVRLAITACQDFMPTSEIQPGVVLNWIGYEEDRVHHCFELDGHRKGYSLERDQNNVPIRHDFAAEIPRPRTSRTGEGDSSPCTDTTASARPGAGR